MIPVPVRRHPILAALSTLLLAAGAALALLLLALPDVRPLRSGWPERTAYMEVRLSEARERGETLRIDYRPVPLSRIPPAVRRTVLVAEDAAFYGHTGFDWHELRAALDRAWQEKRLPRGASTISQQLARNLYLSPDRNPIRKLREALIARRLERTLDKNRILELYLNVIEFGPGVFGVEAAARRYFGTGVSALGPREAARLAATIPSPRRHNPGTDTRTFRWRTGLVYRRAFGAEERIEVAEPPALEIELEAPAAPEIELDPGAAEGETDGPEASAEDPGRRSAVALRPPAARRASARARPAW